MRMKLPNKYKNVRTTIDGITFDSKAEARRYSELKLLKQANEILWFHRQPSFVLSEGIRYRPDFIVNDGEKIWVEDVKGTRTREFELKRKLWETNYHGLELRIIK